MSDEKWIGQPLSKILSTKAQVMKGAITKYHPGCFRFDDGTTQGWTIDQLYNAQTPFQQIFPYPVPGQSPGFTLKNSQKLALAAETALLVVTDFSVTMCEFFLDSPNLLNESSWQSSNGYSLDLYRTFTSPIGEPKPLADWYQAQLQILFLDTKDNTLHTFAEWDAAKQNFLFHVVSLMKAYHIEWKFPRKRQYKVVKVRVRLMMPTYTGPGMLEYLPKGSWLIGNVCPIQ